MTKMKHIVRLIIMSITATFISCSGTVSEKRLKTGKYEITASNESGIVQTQYGKVAGYVDNGIFVYKGIPYAKAERFMPPVKADSWEGIRSSRAYGPTAPQEKRTGWYSDEQAFAFDWNDGFPDEDCLRVNIWTPGVNDEKKRPVMVWLHGGGYSAGSGQELPSYDGLNLAASGDVVVVSLNHRLNVLGFLDLSAFGDKYSKSGNVGMLDIVEALKWVRDNISAFGGDSSNVTLFGQSGGGGKVTTLLAMPSANGLFHKSIVQSGSILTTMTSKWSRRIGAAVVKELGISPNKIDEISKVPYDELLAAGQKAIATVRPEAEKAGFDTFLFGWAPTVDGNILPSQPCSQESLNRSKHIPMIVGSTLHEFTTSSYVPQLRGINEDQAAEFLKSRYGDRVGEYVELLKKAYPQSNPLDLIDTDYTFRPWVVDQAASRSRLGGAPTYMYLFTWQSPVMDGMLRSTHCMEIPFVFNNTSLHATMTGGGAEAAALGDKMSSAWINFARTGNPNTPLLPEWKEYTCEEGAAMIFDNECEVRYGHDRELVDFFRQFKSLRF